MENKLNVDGWRPGMVIGAKYALVRPLGRGGVGSVFEAQNTWTGRRVAIKVLNPALANDASSVSRFILEARSTSSIAHPNIVDVLDMGQEPGDGWLFIVQEFLDGEDLRQSCKERPVRSPTEALALMLPIMRALAAAHAQGVIHRDVKPENIFLTRSPEGITPKLIDFGLAKMLQSATNAIAGITGPGSILGTPEYMSPEQIQNGSSVGVQTDVWAAGIVLYELLAGRGPFTGKSSVQIVLSIITATSTPRIETYAPETPKDLADAIHGALERNLSKRYATMEQFIAALEACGPFPELVTEPTLPFRREHLFGQERKASIEAPRLYSLVIEEEELTNLLQDKPFDIEELPVRHSRSWSAADTAPLLRSAEYALEVNDLNAALARAKKGLEEAVVPSARGAFLLVQTLVHNWQGDALSAERCALEAISLLDTRDPRWYQAQGELAFATSRCGHFDRLFELVSLMQEHVPEAEHQTYHVVVLSRIVLELLRTERAGQSPLLLEQAVAYTLEDPYAIAWYNTAQAAVALHGGLADTGLSHLERAVQLFAEAGDARNTSLQRAIAGDALLQMGLYEEAQQTLENALIAADSMQLFFTGAVKASLALAYAYTGAFAEAERLATEAIEWLHTREDRHSEALARIRFGLVLLGAKKFDGAEREARQAAKLATHNSALRAYAMAVLGAVLLELGQTQKALTTSQKAVLVLQSLQGTEEGEAMIRRVYAQALHASGYPEQAHEALRVAHTRLLERAGKLTDPGHRKAFLERVPEHAQTIALTKAWLADSSAKA